MSLGCKRTFPAAPSPRAPCCQQCPVRDPHSSEMQSTQQACAWRWHKGGFQGQLTALQGLGNGGAVAGNQHCPSWLRGASMWYFCSDSDTLSVLWDEHFAQSAKELWGQSHPASVGQSEQQISPLMLQISRKTGGTEVQLCQLPLPPTETLRAQPNPTPPTPPSYLQTSVPELGLRFPLGSKGNLDSLLKI